MRKIEKEMSEAVSERRGWHKSNTEVCVVRKNGKVTDIVVKLFGNNIYHWNDRTGRHFSTCGYNTATTSSRLQALGCHCHIEKGVIVNPTTKRRINSRPVGCFYF